MASQNSKSNQVAARVTPIVSRRIEELVAGGWSRSSADFAREDMEEKLRSL